MRSNKYVYPTTTFRDLSKKKFLDNFIGGKEITFDDLKKEIFKIKQPRIIPFGSNQEEKILNIFLHPEILFGPKKFVLEKRDEWLEKFSYFIRRKKPLQFTILGFPFKMPVPLKTDRVMPDMGEVLALRRLKAIIENIKKIYNPGAVIYIFTEGGFGKFSGVPSKDWQAYDKFLRRIIKDLGWEKELKVKKLSDMERLKEFKKIFKKRIEENKQLFQARNPEFMKKYNAVKIPIFRVVRSKNKPLEVLMDVYNQKLKDADLSEGARQVRRKIQQDTNKCIIHYFAYLKTRDDLNFLEKKVPHHLPLSVSPKPGRLGIIPVNRKCRLLPYHGVPVFFAPDKYWGIEYLIDIRRSRKKYKKVFLKGDWDKKPFYYIQY